MSVIYVIKLVTVFMYVHLRVPKDKYTHSKGLECKFNQFLIPSNVLESPTFSHNGCCLCN